MTNLYSLRPRRARAIALPLLILACSGLAACGSSSSTTGSNAAATGSAGAAATSSPASAATTKATGTSGSTGSAASAGSGASSAGGSGSASNSTSSTATRSSGAAAAQGKSRFGNTHFRQALVVFADCLRRNGVPIPQPNTTGKGPLFDTRGLDTTSPKFRQARQKCRSTLLSALRAAAHRRAR